MRVSMITLYYIYYVKCICDGEHTDKPIWILSIAAFTLTIYVLKYEYSYMIMTMYHVIWLLEKQKMDSMT